MNFLKSESYNLSPDQYRQKFKNPHQVISYKGSTLEDEKDQAILDQILVKNYNDTSLTSQLKERIVTVLSQAVDLWMHDVAELYNQPDNFKALGYGLKVFGSYFLKTNSHDGDIDMICIVPEYFSRQKHFFVQLAGYFRKNEQIQDIYAIPDAMVPLMRLTLFGVQIDLLLARIKETFLQNNPLFLEINTSFHASIQEKELRSLNGYRAALYFERNYVEGYCNYRVTLKAIKLWARNKGVYSQIYGYLGSAAFSIMLAKICQLYPSYSSLQLLDRFFFIYANWVWTIPVIIDKMDYIERLQSEMVIFTPLDPHMNAAHYISKTTCAITRKQFRLASKIIQEINKGKLIQQINKGPRKWEDLFTPFDFFAEYRHFIQISVMGQRMEDYIPWKGNIESKIRKFIMFLQTQAQFGQGLEINPYPRYFPSKHTSFKLCARYYIGIKCNPNSAVNDYVEIDLTQAVRSFLQLLESYSQIDKAPKDINIGFTHLSRQAIPQDVLITFSKFFQQNK